MKTILIPTILITYKEIQISNLLYVTLGPALQAFKPEVFLSVSNQRLLSGKPASLMGCPKISIE